MTVAINAITDRHAQILAVTFQLQICVESLAMAIKWLANDIRSNDLEREMQTVVALEQNPIRLYRVGIRRPQSSFLRAEALRRRSLLRWRGRGRPWSWRRSFSKWI